MKVVNQEELRTRYNQAVDSLINKIKDDMNIIAVIVSGSLAYDVLWEKSDIDMTMIVRDQTLKNKDYSIVEDGITINVYLMTRSEFKRELERQYGGAFSRAYYSKGKMVYSTDESLVEYFEELKQVGRYDMAWSVFYKVGFLIDIYEKSKKWLNVRKDPLYAQYYLLKAAEGIADIECILNGEPTSRESLQKSMKFNPEAIKPFYHDAMSRHLNEEEIINSIEMIDSYLMNHIDLIKEPVIEFMHDQEIKTSTLISKFFNIQSHFIINVFEYLVDKGVIEKVSQTIRLTPKGKQVVEEIGYIYISE